VVPDRVGIASHFVAALLLPLYYLADATILVQRLAAGERVWDPTGRIFISEPSTTDLCEAVVTRVFLLNLLLTGLAVGSVVLRSTVADIAAADVGALGVTAVLARFSRAR